MAEDLDDDWRIFNRDDDLQGAAAVGTIFNVDIEDPFKQPGPVHAWCLPLTLGVTGRRLGGTFWRSGSDFTAQLRVGASAPWKLIRWRRGRGTRAARRSMNSSGSMTIWVGPFLYGLFSGSTTWPARLRLSRSLAMAGRVM